MKKRGFTLIEMLIVIVIIGILAGALIPRIGTARDKANDTAREANVRSLATALVSLGLDQGQYPEEAADHTLTDGLLTNYSIPENNFANQPTDGQVYHYIRIDNGAHFLVYTELSDNSNAGNCNTTAVDAHCNDDSDKTQAQCTGDNLEWIPATEGIGNIADYNDANELIRNEGNSFCYLQ